MSIELTPLGVACNLGCSYCYQDPMRDAGNITTGKYDVEAMKRGLEAEGGRFSIFGGEPLLVPLPILEELWAWGLARFGGDAKAGEAVNSIQTNGTLVTPAHVAAFQRYRVSVGISLDGPEELNDARWAGSLPRTRAQTATSDRVLRELLAAGVATSLIVTLHQRNASPARLPRLLTWLRELHGAGLRWARLHLLEVDMPAAAPLVLGQEEGIEAFLACAALEEELAAAGGPALRFDVFTDMLKLLRGDDRDVTCTWRPCDPFTTDAVHGVDGQGERTNCGRTNKDGVAWRKAAVAGHERQLALYHTPQEQGGCQGCRFFAACLGQCPGTAIGGDWRNRSEGCPLWMALFEEAEARLVAAGETPLSLRGDRAAIEGQLLAAWAAGHAGSLYEASERAAGRTPAGTAGHGDAPHGDRPHGDAPHGDAPHGDAEQRLLGRAPVRP